MAPPARAGTDRKNNFNFLRLLLATLVILAHSPELIDGNRHREILTRLFHTLSFGDLAVDGFFLLSGYLITQSWLRKPLLLDFLKKRALRIYPGFIVCSCVCAFLIGPLGAGVGPYFSEFRPLFFLRQLVVLGRPGTPPVFQGQPYPEVDGPMWTIPYEFRCYLAVALLGMLGLTRYRALWPFGVALFLTLSLYPGVAERLIFPGAAYLLGDPAVMTHFLAFFLSGACFYLFRDRITYRPWGAALAALLLLPCLFESHLVQIGLATAGVYLLFWFAFTPIRSLERFQRHSDISYGLYLYGWPVQKLLLWYIPSLSPWALFPLALGLAGLCGWASWQGVELPFLRLKSRPDPRDTGQIDASEGATAHEEVNESLTPPSRT